MPRGLKKLDMQVSATHQKQEHAPPPTSTPAGRSGPGGKNGKKKEQEKMGLEKFFDKLDEWRMFKATLHWDEREAIQRTILVVSD